MVVEVVKSRVKLVRFLLFLLCVWFHPLWLSIRLSPVQLNFGGLVGVFVSLSVIVTAGESAKARKQVFLKFFLPH